MVPGKIAVAGSTNMDMVVKLPSGKSGNQAVAIARMEERWHQLPCISRTGA